MEERGEGSRRGGTTEGRARAHGSSSSPPACRVGSSRTPLGHPAPPGGRCAVRHIRNPPPPTGHLPPSHPRSAAGHLDAPDEDLEQVLPHLPPRESARPCEGPERRRGRQHPTLPGSGTRSTLGGSRPSRGAGDRSHACIACARANIHTDTETDALSHARRARKSSASRSYPTRSGTRPGACVRACVRAC